MAGEGRILIVTSVEAEREAVRRGLGGSDRFDVIAAGVGQAASAASTSAALAAGSYELVINAGIGGGFAGQAEIGTIVIASEIVAADLGAENEGGFILIDELGFGSARLPVHEEITKKWNAALQQGGISSIVAPILTVSTVTGSANTAIVLAERVPGAGAEAMEGFGAGTAARQFHVPVVEIRAISNAVGPRDRASWRIKDALQALESASAILLEVV